MLATLLLAAAMGGTTATTVLEGDRQFSLVVRLAPFAPFILVALGPAPPEGFPDPAKHLPRPPNNHLQYAITWYGLAAVLVVIFAIWSRKVLRE